MPVFARQHPGRTGVHLALDGHRLLFCYFIFIRRIILLYLPTSRHLLGVIQQQKGKRKLVFLLFCGFERQLLATVLGTVATAVAFPQKSESTFPHQKSTGLDRDLSFFTYSLFIIHFSLFILLQVFALLFSFALNIMYTSRHLNQRSDTHEIHHQGGL